MMLYVGKNKIKQKIQEIFFSWSYMFQIEECQVKIQYKSHLIEFQHHIEEVQRFFINQVNLKFFDSSKNKLFLFIDRIF
jgi:hypothetical protein